MKKALAALVVTAALVLGSVSFAGTGPRTGGGRTDINTPSLDCTLITASALECQDFSSLK